MIVIAAIAVFTFSATFLVALAMLKRENKPRPLKMEKDCLKMNWDKIKRDGRLRDFVEGGTYERPNRNA